MRKPSRMILLSLLPAAAVASMLLTGATTARAAQLPCTPGSPGVCISLTGASGIPTGGAVTVSFPATSSTATGVDAFQAELSAGFQPNPNLIYVPGGYTVSFSNCSGGSAAGGTYLVGSGNQYPAPPVDALGTTYGASNSPLSFVADTVGGILTCDFSVVNTGALSPATLAVPNDLFAFFGDGTSASSAARVACGPPTAGGSGAVSKNIATDGGCDDSNGTATYPVTGFITLTFPTASSRATGVDAFQAKPSQVYVSGSYSVTFSHCTGGTSSGGTYQVGSGNQFATPPTNAGGTTYSAANSPLSFTATAAGGSVSCAYSVTSTGAFPNGTVSMTNDIFVFFSDGTSGQFASESVRPFSGAPVIVPEVPQVALLAVAGVGATACVAARRRWRRLGGKARGPHSLHD